MLIRGRDLNAAQRELVLSAFVNRHTVERDRVSEYGCANCAQNKYPLTTGQALPDGPHTWTQPEWHAYHVAHGGVSVTDAQWVDAHAFHFTKDGRRLMANRHFAEMSYAAD